MKKIIVIDDIKGVLNKENSFLERNSIEVYPVPSNVEALLVHREIMADLIITYLDMPDMSGEEFCSAVRKDTANPKAAIIIVTPRSKRCEERAKECSADVVITAPFSADVLLRKAYNLLHIPFRAEYRVPVSIRIKGTGENDKPFLGFSENLSATGMLLGSDRKLKKGERLVCSFFLGGEERLTVDAEIVRFVDKPKVGVPNRYGLRFLDVTAGLAVEIDCFVHNAFEED